MPLPYNLLIRILKVSNPWFHIPSDNHSRLGLSITLVPADVTDINYVEHRDIATAATHGEHNILSSTEHLKRLADMTQATSTNARARTADITHRTADVADDVLVELNA